LERRLFVQDAKKPFRYTKGVGIEGESYQVLIELLAGGSPPPNGLRHIQVEDVYVSVIRGMEVAPENPQKVRLPSNASRSVAVSSLPAFFAMKAVALSHREELNRTKDAYDIVYWLRNYPGGVHVVAEQFRSALSNPIVASGVALLRELFASTKAVGPMAYARETVDLDEAALKQREAFERVAEFLQMIA
jgi:hypothetical protein